MNKSYSNQFLKELQTFIWSLKLQIVPWSCTSFQQKAVMRKDPEFWPQKRASPLDVSEVSKKPFLCTQKLATITPLKD